MNEALAGLSLQQNASEPFGLEEIVQKCCDCFEGDPSEPAEPLPEWLFAISEWLTDANNADLLGMFLALFQEDPLAYGQKVCLAVGFWIRHFPFHFDGNPQLCRILERLKRLAAADESIPRPLLDELLDISTIPSFAWLRNPSTRNPAMSRHVSLNFLQCSADDIANCMSQIDHKVLSRVSVIELKRYVQSGGRLTNQTPFLERSISIFNCFSGWVQATILSKTTPAERAQVIQKFVDVGRQLHRQNNFNTLMALIGGITHSNILRLAQTQALISADISAQLNEFTELLSFSSNYSRYRHNLKEASRFRIPIMGVHLKDLLAFWHNADLENYEKSKRISQRCIGQLAYLLAHFLSVKRMQPNFGEANLELINTMKVLLDSPIVYDEVELYNLSLKREAKGKEAGEQICRQQAPTVFADWAKGVSKRADPESVDKHIKEMVDAIFKYYDDDKDGNIGRREFEQFIGNFTFVEPMEGINYDQNGLISRKEMLQYFGRKLKNGEFGQQQGHQWVDWHFLAPTICANCNKLLWMRHGSKCSRCTLSTHQNCKQNSPNSVECRRLADVGVGEDAGPSNSSPSSGLGSWLNLNASSLSPRFTAFGPSSVKSPIIHQHLANGRAAQYQQQMPSTSGGKDNKNAEGGTNRHVRGIRRVRTSSSSTTSDGSSSTREMGSGAAAGGGGPLLPAVQTARDNFGVLRSSFHRFLRRTGAGQEGSREREAAEKTKSRKSSENTAEKSKRAESSRTDSSSKEDGNAPGGGIIEQTTARASLASEEVFEEEELGEREPAKMERKGKG